MEDTGSIPWLREGSHSIKTSIVDLNRDQVLGKFAFSAGKVTVPFDFFSFSALPLTSQCRFCIRLGSCKKWILRRRRGRLPVPTTR